jgi:hypothetical protein
MMGQLSPSPPTSIKGYSPLAGLADVPANFMKGFGDDLNENDLTPAQRIGRALIGGSGPPPAPLFGIGPSAPPAPDMDDPFSASGPDFSPDGLPPLRLDFLWD